MLLDCAILAFSFKKKLIFYHGKWNHYITNCPSMAVKEWRSVGFYKYKEGQQSPWQHTTWQVDIRVGLVGSDLLILWSPHQRLKYQVVLAAINHVAMLYIMLSTWHKASHISSWILSLLLQCFWSDNLNSHKNKGDGNPAADTSLLCFDKVWAVFDLLICRRKSGRRSSEGNGCALNMSDGETVSSRSFFIDNSCVLRWRTCHAIPKWQRFSSQQKWNASLLLSEIAPSSFSKEVLSISGPDSQPSDKPLPTL